MMVRRAGGSWLPLIILFLAALGLWGRGTLREEGPPAFFVEEPRARAVWLGTGFPDQGVHQFSDGSSVVDVISLTTMRTCLGEAVSGLGEIPLLPGLRLDLSPLEAGGACRLVVGWMSAEQRLSLGIPLHPERMSVSDWETLPGIGPKLAQAIEQDRQLNGDFGSIEALARVRGIGPKRISALKMYFE